MNENAKQLAALLSEECQSLSDVQDMLKTLFKGTIERMLETHTIYTLRATLPSKLGIFMLNAVSPEPRA